MQEVRQTLPSTQDIINTLLEKHQLTKVANCINYATGKMGGLPGHHLLVIVSRLYQLLYMAIDHLDVNTKVQLIKFIQDEIVKETNDTKHDGEQKTTDSLAS